MLGHAIGTAIGIDHVKGYSDGSRGVNDMKHKEVMKTVEENKKYLEKQQEVEGLKEKSKNRDKLINCVKKISMLESMHMNTLPTISLHTDMTAVTENNVNVLSDVNKSISNKKVQFDISEKEVNSNGNGTMSYHTSTTGSNSYKDEKVVRDARYAPQMSPCTRNISFSSGYHENTSAYKGMVLCVIFLKLFL